MSEPVTIQQPANSVTIMVGDVPFMIHAEMTDTTVMVANRVQREIAVGLLQAAVEVMWREPDPLGPLLASASRSEGLGNSGNTNGRLDPPTAHRRAQGVSGGTSSGSGTA